jgi:hypothetical protein
VAAGRLRGIYTQCHSVAGGAVGTAAFWEESGDRRDHRLDLLAELAGSVRKQPIVQLLQQQVATRV